MKAVNLKDVNPSVHNPRANFDLSFNRKFNLKFGQLFPILMQPTIPGDKFRLSAEHVVRFAPFISQVYQNYYISYDYYFVPNRLLWPAFDNYMKGVGNHVHPYLDCADLRSSYSGTHHMVTSLFDALDIPDNFFENASGAENYISALPFGAYYRCLLDYHIGVDTPLSQLLESLISKGYMFQDGNAKTTLVNLAASVLSGNPNTVVTPNADLNQVFQLPERLYPLDYFTHARSNPQLGPVMTIPVELVNTDPDGTKQFVVSGSGVPHKVLIRLILLFLQILKVKFFFPLQVLFCPVLVESLSMLQCLTMLLPLTTSTRLPVFMSCFLFMV